MGYRNKTFVSFDGDNDIHYYYLMRAWKDNDNTSFNFYDAHDINTAREKATKRVVVVGMDLAFIPEEEIKALVSGITRSSRVTQSPFTNTSCYISPVL